MKLLRSVNEFTAFTNLKLPPWLNLTYIHMHPLTRRPSKQSDPWYEVPCASQTVYALGQHKWFSILQLPRCDISRSNVPEPVKFNLRAFHVACKGGRAVHVNECTTALNMSSPASAQPAMACESQAIGRGSMQSMQVTFKNRFPPLGSWFRVSETRILV